MAESILLLISAAKRFYSFSLPSDFLLVTVLLCDFMIEELDLKKGGCHFSCRSN